MKLNDVFSFLYPNRLVQRLQRSFWEIKMAGLLPNKLSSFVSIKLRKPLLGRQSRNTQKGLNEEGQHMTRRERSRSWLTLLVSLKYHTKSLLCLGKYLGRLGLSRTLNALSSRALYLRSKTLVLDRKGVVEQDYYWMILFRPCNYLKKRLVLSRVLQLPVRQQNWDDPL